MISEGFTGCAMNAHGERAASLGDAQPVRMDGGDGGRPSGMKPSASAMQAMVQAVPMTPQVPAVVASLPSISPIRSARTSPAR